MPNSLHSKFRTFLILLSPPPPHAVVLGSYFRMLPVPLCIPTAGLPACGAWVFCSFRVTDFRAFCFNFAVNKSAPMPPSHPHRRALLPSAFRSWKPSWPAMGYWTSSLPVIPSRRGPGATPPGSPSSPRSRPSPRGWSPSPRRCPTRWSPPRHCGRAPRSPRTAPRGPCSRSRPASSGPARRRRRCRTPP